MAIKATVVAVGGAGINILKLVLTSLYGSGDKLSFGVADTKFKAIDITKSNLSGIDKYLKPDDVFIIPNEDGSGKSQADAMKASKQYVNDIIKSIDGDMIIFIFGASGGAGGGIALQLINEAISREKQKVNTSIVSYVIGSTISEKETMNFKTTLTTLAAISNKHRSPVVAAVYQNTVEMNRDEVNLVVESDVRSMLMFASGENSELDSSDISKLFNYQRVTSNTPQLTFMYTHRGAHDSIPHYSNIVCVGALMVKTSDQVLSVNQAFSSVGYIPDELIQISETSKTVLPETNFIFTNCNVGPVIAMINERIKEFSDQVESFNMAPKIELPEGDDVFSLLS